MPKEQLDFDLDFTLGIEAIDKDHQRLVNLLNRVHALISDGKEGEARAYFSESLTAYISEHFANEEKFMAEIGFPELTEHKNIHDRFRKSVEELMPTLATASDAAFHKALGETYTWIISHIGTIDRKFVKYYNSRQ